MNQVIANGLKQYEYLELFTKLQKLWRDWERDCITAGVTLGTLQVSVPGGSGNIQAYFVRLGPFDQP